MNISKKIITVIAAAIISATALSGCAPSTDYSERKALQKETTLENSLEKANLKEKLERENDPNAVRYVYLMNFGQIVGYYVIKGKVSSAGSQLAPEEEVIRPYSGEYLTLDSAQDDGTYGSGDPGIFFFLADGSMISTSLDYIESDNIIPVDVPRIGG